MRCDFVVQLLLLYNSDFEFYAFGGFTVHFYFKLGGATTAPDPQRFFLRFLPASFLNFAKEISGKIGGEVNFL